jgi:hypothetical protein
VALVRARHRATQAQPGRLHYIGAAAVRTDSDSNRKILWRRATPAAVRADEHAHQVIRRAAVAELGLDDEACAIIDLGSVTAGGTRVLGDYAHSPAASHEGRDCRFRLAAARTRRSICLRSEVDR